MHCLFVSDLHGSERRYRKLWSLIAETAPAMLFMGGDLLPSGPMMYQNLRAGLFDFVEDILIAGFDDLRTQMGESYPDILLILGNDDERYQEEAVIDGEKRGLWHYAHNRMIPLHGYDFYGYACVPPSPFRLKDWERYDVSRFVDPGAISPEEGMYTIEISDHEKKYMTMQHDLTALIRDNNVSRAVFLFHSPPYQTKLDRAALDGKMIDYAPLDVHVGSIAIKRMIENSQPYLTLHGHIHESALITGSWRDCIGVTQCFSAAHHGPELAVVSFDLDQLKNAERHLL